MKIYLRSCAVAGIACFLLLFEAHVANAHPQDLPAAVEDLRIVWESESEWGFAGRSIYHDNIEAGSEAWNQLGTVTILKDNIFRSENLKWIDVFDCGFIWNAEYFPGESPKQIRINLCRIGNRDFNEKEITGIMAHELAHALDIGHAPQAPPELDCQLPLNINDERCAVSAAASTTIVPNAHDEDDYFARWGRPPLPCTMLAQRKTESSVSNRIPEFDC